MRRENLTMQRILHSAIIFMMAISTEPLFAQGPSMGIKGGVNLSTLAVNEADDEKGRIGFNVGVFGRTDPEQPFGLQAELLYSTKGAQAQYSGFFGLVDQEVDFNLNYIELPVLASFRLGSALEVQAGGYAGFLLSANVKTSGDLGSGEEELDKDNFQSLDYGVGGGVALNAGAAQIGLRYLHGLAEVANSDASDVILGNSTNRCVQLYVAFGLGAN